MSYINIADGNGEGQEQDIDQRGAGRARKVEGGATVVGGRNGTRNLAAARAHAVDGRRMRSRLSCRRSVSATQSLIGPRVLTGGASSACRLGGPARAPTARRRGVTLGRHAAAEPQTT